MLYLGIFFIVIIIALLFIKLNIVIEYIRNGWDDHIVLSFFTLKGVIKYKYEIPLIDLETNGIKFIKYRIKKDETKDESSTDDGMLGFSRIIEQFKYFRRIYSNNKAIICKIRDYAKGRVVISELDLKVNFGAGEAHYTGILNGVIWSLYGTAISYITNTFKVLKNNVKIKSDYSKNTLKVDLYCIFTFKLAYIIVMGLIFAFRYKEKIFIHKKMIGGDLNG